MIAILSANVKVIFGGASAFLGIHRINYTHVTSMGMGKHKVGVMLIMDGIRQASNTGYCYLQDIDEGPVQGRRVCTSKAKWFRL